MRCYCYTDDLEVLHLELPVEEIAADRIDPWRIDLCDPNPLKKTIGGRVLNFRRLQSLALMYRTESGGAVVWMHDGVEETCVQGDFIERDGCPAVANLRPSDDSYERHLIEYLCLFEDKQFANHTEYYQDFCRTKMKNDEDILPPNKTADGVFLPRPKEQVRCDNQIHIGWGTLDGCTRGMAKLQGEMFERLEFDTKLPDSISWVFEALEEYNPIVFGPCLRDHFLGKPVKQVHVLIKTFHHVEPLQRLLQREGVEIVQPQVGQMGWSEVVCDGVHYYIWGLFHTQQLAILNYDAVRMLCHTADCLFADNPEEFSGFRIAFNDIGLGRARLLAEGDGMVVAPRDWLAKNLEREGFQFVKTIPSVSATD